MESFAFGTYCRSCSSTKMGAPRRTPHSRTRLGSNLLLTTTSVLGSPSRPSTTYCYAVLVWTAESTFTISSRASKSRKLKLARPSQPSASVRMATLSEWARSSPARLSFTISRTPNASKSNSKVMTALQRFVPSCSLACRSRARASLARTISLNSDRCRHQWPRIATRPISQALNPSSLQDSQRSYPRQPTLVAPLAAPSRCPNKRLILTRYQPLEMDSQYGRSHPQLRAHLLSLLALHISTSRRWMAI
mmetsp:Transcript_11876/g.15118  ORF Transcript_11876/g.15118 Transcript_11876/m.15118 type:complete len:249 (-) Transcript_11876:815-1561(-)